MDDRHSVATSMTVDGQVRTIDVTDLRIMCRQFKEGHRLVAVVGCPPP